MFRRYGFALRRRVSGWTAYALLLLSLELAALTVAILVPAGSGARALAAHEFAGKPVVEALFALPLVLPPTVLGYYLLVALGGRSPLGRWYEALSGIRWCSPSTGCSSRRSSSTCRSRSSRCSAPSRRFRRGPAARRPRAAACPLAEPVADRAAARVARHPDRRGADLRSHAGRVRRRADGRRQHSRRDEDDRDRDLRPRAGDSTWPAPA